MTLPELTKLIEALTAAGITKWLLVFFVVFVLLLALLIVVAIRVVPSWLRNMREKNTQESALQIALTNAVTALTANNTALTTTSNALTENLSILTRNQAAMQESAGRRDDQMDRMNDINLQSAKTADDQRNLLLQQNALLEKLSTTSESGNTYVRSLTESIIASAKDNASAISAWGETSTENTNRVGAEIVEKINSIPSEVIKQAAPAIDAIRDDLNKILTYLPPGNDQLIKAVVTKVSDDIRQIVGEMIAKVMADCLIQTQQIAVESGVIKPPLTPDPIIHAATGTTLPPPASPASPASPAPTTNTAIASSDSGAA